MSSNELSNLFFSDLKKYNLTNYKTLERADLSDSNPIVHKAFSSAITRYFIFCERHPEISEADKKLLYYMVKVDMVARYFSEYPDADIDCLRQFQDELRSSIHGGK